MIIKVFRNKIIRAGKLMIILQSVTSQIMLHKVLAKVIEIGNKGDQERVEVAQQL